MEMSTQKRFQGLFLTILLVSTSYASLAFSQQSNADIAHRSLACEYELSEQKIKYNKIRQRGRDIIKDKNKEIDLLQTQLNESRSIIAEQEQIIAEQAATIAEQEALIAQLEASILALDAEIQALLAMIAELENLIESLQQNTTPESEAVLLSIENLKAAKANLIEKFNFSKSAVNKSVKMCKKKLKKAVKKANALKTLVVVDGLKKNP